MSKQLSGIASAIGIVKGNSALLAAAAMSLLLVACGGGSDKAGSVEQKAQQSRKSANVGATPASAYVTVTQQLYVAYFGRPADAAGLAAFEAMLAKDGAPTDIASLATAYAGNPAIQSLVDGFSGSAESQALYGGSTTAEFVSSVYQNVLGRAPAAAGLSFWTSAIDSGQLSKGDAALAIMAGALGNTTAAGQLDALLVDNRIGVAAQFTALVASPTGLAGYRGAAAAQSARNLLGVVTAGTDLQAYSSNVNTLATAIADNTFYINVSVSGLSPNDQLVLQNGSDTLGFSSNTSAKFAVPQINGSTYSVTAASLPPEAECTIANGSGTGTATSPANVSVNCHGMHVYVFYYYSRFFAQYALQPDLDLAPLPAPTVPVAGGVSAAMIDPTGQHAYVSDYDGTILQQFNVDAGGNMTPMAVPSVTAGSFPRNLIMDPQAQHLYASATGSGGIWQYAIGADGSLAPLSPAYTSAFGGPVQMTMDPSGKYFYATGAGSVGELSVGANGALVPLAASLSISGTAQDVLASPSGKYAYVASQPGIITEYAIGADGTLSMVSSVTADSVYNDEFKLFIEPRGKYLYAVPKDGSQIYQFVIGANGGLTPLVPASLNTPTSLGAVAMDKSGRYLLTVDWVANVLDVYGIGATGTLSLQKTVQLNSGDTAGAIIVY